MRRGLSPVNPPEFRKLTSAELEVFGIVIPTTKYKAHVAFAKKYYPPEATSLVMCINSEYNDNTYDNNLAYIIVYDKNGNELPPLKTTAKECREKWFDLPVPGMSKYGSSEEPVENVSIPLVELPDLYIKN